MDPTLGTSDSCWAVHGDRLGAVGYLSGGLGGHREPLGDAWVLPEGVQSHFKIIEKPFVSIAFLSIGVIWNLSGGVQAAFWASREALLGVDITQGKDLVVYFRFLQKTEKGQRLLTFKGGGSTAVERRCEQVGGKSTDEIGPAERGKGECFASPQEMEGDGLVKIRSLTRREKETPSIRYGGYVNM